MKRLISKDCLLVSHKPNFHSVGWGTRRLSNTTITVHLLSQQDTQFVVVCLIEPAKVDEEERK